MGPFACRASCPARIASGAGSWRRALVSARGFCGTLLFLRETYLNPWLRPDRLRALRTRTPQLRLIL